METDIVAQISRIINMRVQVTNVQRQILTKMNIEKHIFRLSKER